jgi:hypothetical protein
MALKSFRPMWMPQNVWGQQCVLLVLATKEQPGANTSISLVRHIRGIQSIAHHELSALLQNAPSEASFLRRDAQRHDVVFAK